MTTATATAPPLQLPALREVEMPTINAKSNNQPVWEKETNEKSMRMRGEMIKNKQQQATCNAGPMQ